MRKITGKERRKAGNIYCPYCKPEKVNATYRTSGWTDVSCEKHKNNLYEDDDRLTEADYQTWMRI
jgi:hypothetical protein